MVSSASLSHKFSFQMAKRDGRYRAASLISDGFLFATGALVALLVIRAVWFFIDPTPNTTPSLSTIPDRMTTLPQRPGAAAALGGESASCPDGLNLREDPPDANFYDDPKLAYTIDSPPVKNWDEKRREWLRQHPSFATGAENRIFMVTGSQPTPCKNPIGDYLLLKLFKNKVDYCRRHGIDIFYNNALLQPKMISFWAKTPAILAAMLAHPEAEWIWWVDLDAVFTDMDFVLPLDRYKDHNFVVHGWSNMIEKRSWTSVNAGVFLIRNCQWTMDFMEVWARMSPQSPDYDKWGEILSATFKDKIFPESDDQSGLIYLISNEKEKWGNRIYLEDEYYFEGYWVEIVGTLENITEGYAEVERKDARLRRRRAEKVNQAYGGAWEEGLKAAGAGGGGRGSWRRPFVTHFTGCQPCSGDHNEMYTGQTCVDAMQKALIFADNQVLRSYGFAHPDLLDPAAVTPLPFDYPALPEETLP